MDFFSKYFLGCFIGISKQYCIFMQGVRTLGGRGQGQLPFLPSSRKGRGGKQCPLDTGLFCRWLILWPISLCLSPRFSQFEKIPGNLFEEHSAMDSYSMNKNPQIIYHLTVVPCHLLTKVLIENNSWRNYMGVHKNKEARNLLFVRRGSKFIITTIYELLQYDLYLLIGRLKWKNVPYWRESEG